MRRFFLGITLGTMSLGLWPLSALAAGSATFGLSSADGSPGIGSSYTVTISENSGTEPVNAVEADLSYNPSILQYDSIDASASAFGIGAASSGGGGAVKMSRGTINSVSGNNIVASVSFTVVGAGPIALSFASSSAILRDPDSQNIWVGAPTAGGGTGQTQATPVVSSAPLSGNKTATPVATPSPTATSSVTQSPSKIPLAGANHASTASAHKAGWMIWIYTALILALLIGGFFVTRHYRHRRKHRAHHHQSKK